MSAVVQKENNNNNCSLSAVIPPRKLRSQGEVGYKAQAATNWAS